MGVLVEKCNELSVDDITLIGSAFMNAIIDESRRLPELTFVLRNGRYHYTLQARVFVDAPKELIVEIEENIRESCSKYGAFGGFIIGIWPGVQTIVSGDCFADDCIIFENGKAYFGNVYVDELTCYILRSRS